MKTWYIILGYVLANVIGTTLGILAFHFILFKGF